MFERHEAAADWLSTVISIMLIINEIVCAYKGLPISYFSTIWVLLKCAQVTLHLSIGVFCGMQFLQGLGFLSFCIGEHIENLHYPVYKYFKLMHLYTLSL